MVPIPLEAQWFLGAGCMATAVVWFAISAAFFLTELWAAIFGRVDAGRLKEDD